MDTVLVDGEWEPFDETAGGKTTPQDPGVIAGHGEVLHATLYELYGMTYEQAEKAIAELNASKGN